LRLSLAWAWKRYKRPGRGRKGKAKKTKKPKKPKKKKPTAKLTGEAYLASVVCSDTPRSASGAHSGWQLAARLG
jgi:hypothetical protein